VLCSNCETDNRARAQFCKRCGVWLGAACPHCRAEVPPDSHFCDQCGRRFSDSAIQRGGDSAIQRVGEAAGQPISNSQLPVINYQSPTPTRLQTLIPENLAAKLEAARASRAMQGERRIVTMLFCDVKGSTEAAGSLDPEEWTGLMNQVFDHMIRPIYKYEGTVARLMGDALLAFFGAPIAHEDDPQRAALAGLEIIASLQPFRAQVETQWGLDIDVRVGINTGLVVVGAVGSDLKMEYTALGDAINLAARMEQTAQPGTVQITAETHKLIAPLFEFEDLGEVEAKGKGSIRAYRVLRPRDAPGRLRGLESHGISSPLVGREVELQTLAQRLDSLRAGSGSLTFLLGEAGVGKSRLIAELRQQADPEGGGVYWLEGSALSYRQTSSYYLWRQIIRQAIGAAETDTADEVRTKLNFTCDCCALPGGDRPFLEAILAVESEISLETIRGFSGDALIQKMTEATRGFICGQASEKPTLLIFEDLHWADQASLNLLQNIADVVFHYPLMILCLTRPDKQAGSWALRQTLQDKLGVEYREITLAPLSPETSRTLLANLLAIEDLPETLRRLILEKAEGNPFYVEEVVRALIDSRAVVRETNPGRAARWRAADNIREIHIPENLQSLLTARIDRLEEDARRVLQLASVIGRSFYYRVLEIICDTSTQLERQLANLQQMELIREFSRQPELEYIFRHALTQETAYRSILRQHRREFHLRVGEAMETLLADRLDEYAPVLAMHFQRGEDPRRAIRYLLHAGDLSYRLHTLGAAISHYGQALELVTQGHDGADGAHHSADHLEPEALHRLCLNLGRAYEMAGQYDEALSHYTALEAFARQHGDRHLELALLAAHATIHSAPTEKFNRTLAEEISGKALALAAELGEHATEAKIYWNLMNVTVFSNDVEIGFEYGLKSLEIARRHNLKEQLAYTLNDFQRSYLVSGKLEEAKAMLMEARQLWLELDNRGMYVDSLNSGALLDIIKGQFAEAEADCLQALQISQEIGNLWGEAFSNYTLAFIYFEQSRLNEALRVMQNALDLVEPSGFVMPLIDCNAYGALTYAYLGDFERAYTFGLRALHSAEERLPPLVPGPRGALAIIAYWQGDYAAIDSWLGDTEPVGQLRSFAGFERFIAECYRLLAKGAYEELLAMTEVSRAEIEKMGTLVFMGDILRANGEALAALQRPEEARQFFTEALSRSGHSPHRLVEIYSRLAQLEASLGDETAAAARQAQARQNVARVLQNLDDASLRASFLARPEIKAIWDSAAAPHPPPDPRPSQNRQR
jgi:class 3 adenylate cyclase/tetratricopeptide (TPR) repeat protein